MGRCCIILSAACQTHTHSDIEVDGGRQADRDVGREGARKDGGWEGGRNGRDGFVNKANYLRKQ